MVQPTKKQKRLIAEFVDEMMCLCIITYGLPHFNHMRSIRGLFGELGKFQRILDMVQYGTDWLEYIDKFDTAKIINITQYVDLTSFNGFEPILTYFLKLMRIQRIPEEFRLYNKNDFYQTTTTLNSFPVIDEEKFSKMPRFTNNHYLKDPATYKSFLNPTKYETTTFQQKESYQRIAQIVKKILLTMNSKKEFKRIIAPDGFMGTNGAFIQMVTRLNIIDIIFEIEQSEYKTLKTLIPKIIKVLAKDKRVKKEVVQKATAHEVVFKYTSKDPTGAEFKNRLHSLKLQQKHEVDRIKNNNLAIRDDVKEERSKLEVALKDAGEQHGIKAVEHPEAIQEIELVECDFVDDNGNKCGKKFSAERIDVHKRCAHKIK
jgi:hypothetical protein